MTGRERTLQQRDPLAAVVGRPTSYLAAIGIPTYAAVMVWLNREDISDPGLAIASISLIAITGVAFAFASSPLRAPFTTGMLAAVTATGVAAYVLGQASMWHTNSFVRDDWGAASIALFLLASAPFRPGRQIAVAGVVASAIVAAVTVVESHAFVTAIPAHLFAIVATAPLLILSVGAATFASQLVRRLELWESKETMSVSTLDESRSEWIARSVQQDRVTLLNQTIVPFFAEVLAKESLTTADRERALELSESIRTIMVAEIDRTWLGALVAHSGDGRLDDPRGFADDMNPDQRTVVRAFLVALHAVEGASSESLAIAISEAGSRRSVTMSCDIHTTDYGVRTALDPYLAIMRILFIDLHVDYLQPTLALRFSYGQR